MRRLGPRGADHEAGVYSVLYAALVVVLVAFAAIVVDLSAVRQDRRLNRSAADAAALGGAFFLLPNGTVDPFKACNRAWDYLVATLQLNPADVPAGKCSPFNLTPTQVATLCSTSSPAEIAYPPVTIGRRTFAIAWPVPSTGGSGYLNADIAPGNIAQPFDSSSLAHDGSAAGCDRLGVAINEHQQFGLASTFGPTATDTQVHSVALASVTTGGGDVIAALNVLNPKDCNTLRATGGGQVLVGATLNADGTYSPGTIAVESTAKTTNPGKGDCGGSDHVIAPKGSGALICANGLPFTTFSCDLINKGVIYSRAKFTNPSFAYDPNDVTNGNLSPAPITEPKVYGYTPVTKRYGCNTTRLPACTPPTGKPNYISLLEQAYNTNPPTAYTGTQAPMTNPFPGAFVDATSRGACGTVSGTVVLPAKGVSGSTGNWYCPSGGVNVTGTLVVPNGNFVINGDLNVANGACFVMNTSATTCAASNIKQPATLTATTDPAPTTDSVVYLQNGVFNAQNGSSFLMPQTFMYAYGANAGTITVGATTVALWTAPGAGARDPVTKRSSLEEACFESAKNQPNEDCLNSRFARLAYWSDYAATNNGSSKDTFTGGTSNLSIVGVFFTPTSYVNLAGSSSLPIISQFWADILDVNGGAHLPLTPVEQAAVPIEIGNVALIR
jgi:hypothetical protein